MQGVGRVEDGQDYDCPEVVNDGEGGQEHFDSYRDPVSKNGEHTHGEGDVGCHRDSPSVCRVRIAVVEDGEDESRDNHSSKGCHYRKNRPSDRGELANKNLPLDFQPDNEEEDRHQGIVHPVPEAHLKGEVADVDARVLIPHPVEPLSAWNCSQNHRNDGAGKEQNPACRFIVNEVVENMKYFPVPVLRNVAFRGISTFCNSHCLCFLVNFRMLPPERSLSRAYSTPFWG